MMLRQEELCRELTIISQNLCILYFLVITLDSHEDEVDKFVPNEGKCKRYSDLSQLH